MKTTALHCFLGFTQKCLPALLIAWCLLSPQIAGAKPPIPPTPDYSCQVGGHPWQPVFQDLKGVALVVQVLPNKYMEAAACHGRENECADNAGVASESASARAAYIHSITDDYNSFPLSLHYDNLVKVFTEALTGWVEPFVIPEKCNRPPVAVMTIDDVRDPKNAEKNKDAVTVFVRLLIIDTAKPRIAVLSTGYYRPDEAHSDFSSQMLMGRLTAIPLDLPDDQIVARVAAFAKPFQILTHENAHMDFRNEHNKK